MTKLEQYLDPEDRILAINDINSKWPVLNQLRMKASKSTDTPLLERYISSTSDMTTVGTTSTSPLIEKIVVAGEPANTDEQMDNDDPLKTGSTSTSSLALSKLRGLSSKSLTKPSSSNNDIPTLADINL